MQSCEMQSVFTFLHLWHKFSSVFGRKTLCPQRAFHNNHEYKHPDPVILSLSLSLSTTASLPYLFFLAPSLFVAFGPPRVCVCVCVGRRTRTDFFASPRKCHGARAAANTNGDLDVLAACSDLPSVQHGYTRHGAGIVS